MAGQQTPDFPDPAEFFRSLKEHLKMVLLIVGGLMILFVGSKTFFQVEADEEGVILRLGVPTGIGHGPGLHVMIPFVDRVYISNVKKVHQLEFGFRTIHADVQSEFDQRSFRSESLMLTGDLNLVQVQWTVLYRVADLEAYLFQVRGVEQTIRDISQGALRLLVGDRSNDEVMTLHRAEIGSAAKVLIQDRLDRCDSGIRVESIKLQQVEPPKAAQAAFNKVNEARALKQQVIEQAERRRAEETEFAKGNRNAVVAEARGDKIKMVESAKGEALRFLNVLEEYEKAPAITKRRLYLETMQAALKNASRKLLITNEGGAGDIVKLLPLGDLANLAHNDQFPRGTQPPQTAPLTSPSSLRIAPAPGLKTQPAPKKSRGNKRNRSQR